MARKPRIHFPGAFYHVIAKGNQRQDIYLDEGDFKTYLSYLSEYKSKYNFHLYAYALMKNTHFIAVPRTEDGMRKAIGEAHRRYARMINFREGLRGYLWQASWE